MATKREYAKRQNGVEEDAGTYFSFDLADVKLLYNALKHYKPTQDEEQLYDIWLESFDEIIFEEEGSSEGFPRD